ncbi:hypothetical protein JX265_005993 [Neoarthrinium moseri]|uniref:MARVEL domain-containing protein n=1 Tax=Neoarthrinium moseri TaxID=1658444 RepID=A0A9P9WMG7_9PEZI|nr:uncharacterized protein JN550_004207 [Neoarthrinium moseri]KAI1855590.1 hypothetical protein JX266_000455 [Neoarthrinium moseri]KAI1870953.1 hypothetical protein JX265_005993 [Neoarthrinium moseri]KAI1872004.1 hypothetical protein JN550_004207 [Neoarthrinium moseri]
MTSPAKYSSQRAAGKEHIPIFPKGFIAVRIIQLVLGVVVLGLSAFGVYFLVFSGDCLTLFTAIATIIALVYHLIAVFGAPSLYNYWAILSLDIFLVLFWLISFAVLAAEVAPYLSGVVCYSDGCYRVRLSSADKIYGACMAAAAGVGGLEFIMFIVSLAIHGVMLHRHRKAGLHCMPVHSGAHNASAAPVPAPVAGEKVHAQAQVQPQQQYPQQYTAPQGYAQQPQSGYAAQPTPPQQAYGVAQHQYPQQAPSPLSAQPTGNSYQQTTAQHPPVPGQGPYETHGHSVQPPAQ